MSAKLIDTHFHLDYYKEHEAIYKLINSLRQYTLCMTSSPGVFISCKRLYRETTYLKFALGFHPQNSTLTEKDFVSFLRLLPTSKYIGEVGLDFSSRRYLNKDYQLAYFDEIVKRCASDNKLFSVHIRYAEKQAVSILEKYLPRKCVIHWYSGSEEQLRKLLHLGCYFSVNSNMLSSKKSTAIISAVPLDRLLIESDGPFTNVDGIKYSPEMLKNVYQEVAETLNSKNLSEQVYNNFSHILSA